MNTRSNGKTPGMLASAQVLSGLNLPVPVHSWRREEEAGLQAFPGENYVPGPAQLPPCWPPGGGAHVQRSCKF